MAVLPVVAGYFLLLYAGVGLIQEKRFSGSAPKENPDAIPDRKPERFPGAHILGWTLGVLSLALMVGGFVLGGWDGIRSGFGYWAFFARFVAMLYLVGLYDIVFFDWILLCNSNFFAHFTRNGRASAARTSSATTKRSTPCISCSTCLSAPCWPGAARCFETALFVGQKRGKTSSAY